VQTTDRPIKAIKSLILIMMVDNRTSAYEWTVFDTGGNIMAEEDIRPRS